MEEKEINAEDFMKMFVAISYASEQVYFNFVDLTGYIFGRYTIDGDVYNEFEDVLDSMISDETVTKVEGCNNLYQVNRKFDYINTIKDNRDYLEDMVRLFKCFYDKSNRKLNIRLVSKTNEFSK